MDSEISIKHNYNLILVEWEDSVLGFQGWKLINEQPKEATLFVSVGFLVYENKDIIILYPHIDNSKEDDECLGSGDIIIPKTSIRKRKILI